MQFTYDSLTTNLCRIDFSYFWRFYFHWRELNTSKLGTKSILPAKSLVINKVYGV